MQHLQQAATQQLHGVMFSFKQSWNFAEVPKELKVKRIETNNKRI